MTLRAATRIIEDTLNQRTYGFVFLRDALDGNYDGLQKELNQWYRQNRERLGIDERIGIHGPAYVRLYKPDNQIVHYSDITGVVHSSEKDVFDSNRNLAGKPDWDDSYELHPDSD